MKRLYAIVILVALVILIVCYRPYVWAAVSPLVQKFRTSKNVAQRLEQYGERARARLRPHFRSKQVSYPGTKVVPVDFRLGKSAPQSAHNPKWTASLYETIKMALANLPKER
jgi:hypothetical protein